MNRLISLLQSHRDWPGAVLAERLTISPRTVRRDVDRLRELGYNVLAIKGPDGGYRLEAANLRALATVRYLMPDRLRRRRDALEITVLRDELAGPVAPRALLALGDAIRDRVSVRFDYATPGVEASSGPPRRAEPHHLVAYRGRWYLLAWHLDHGGWRTFRVDRMALRSHTGAWFAQRDLPGGNPAAFVAARFKGSDGVNAWPCNGTVVLRASRASVPRFSGWNRGGCGMGLRCSPSG